MTSALPEHQLASVPESLNAHPGEETPGDLSSLVSPDSGARYLIFVNRNRLRLFKYLVERFANESNIQVFLDRRMKERREPGADSSSDRRRRERRKATPDEVELQAFGFTIVKVNFKVEPES